VQILEAGDEEVEIIVDGKTVKVPGKKKTKKRLYSTDKSEDVMAFLERKRL
jgi:endonuclease YncB( thermonuclease family)